MHHHFYWQTDLSEERQREINAWLATLSEAEEKMVEDLLRDERFETECETHCFGCSCYD